MRINEILVVEDERLHQILIKRAFEGRGHNLTIVGDGRAALDALKKKQFDLVLLDLNIPYLTGHQVMEQMQNGKRVAFIVMTSSEDHEDVEASYRLGASAYVVKPVDYRDVITKAVDWYFNQQVRLPAVGVGGNDEHN